MPFKIALRSRKIYVIYAENKRKARSSDTRGKDFLLACNRNIHHILFLVKNSEGQIRKSTLILLKIMYKPMKQIAMSCKTNTSLLTNCNLSPGNNLIQNLNVE